MSDNNSVIAVIHGDILPDAPPDEKDVLVEVDTVCDALNKLGYKTVRMPFSFDVLKVFKSLEEVKPLCVFNLVESLLGKGSFIHFPLLVYDYLKLPYTGSDSDAMYLTSNKVFAKTALSANNIPTPEWQTLDNVIREGIAIKTPIIIKPVYEDASVGISDDSVFYEPEIFMKEVIKIDNRERKDYFIEQFIEGREINISLLAINGEPRMLPPAEIAFKDYPVDKPKIVGYNAKWEKHSFEYSHTPRTFDFSSIDIPMLGRLEELALKCWKALGLRGYARVDFRIDWSGKPWVLEVNANPCISPDSGFVAAACREGIWPYEKIIENILDDALKEYE